MNSLNNNWNVESTVREKSQANNRFAFFQKATIVFLLLSCTVSVYEALYLVGGNSLFFYPLLGGGLGRIVVAIYCWKGSEKAFQVASVFAVITSAIDVVSSGGISFSSALYLTPQIFVVIFSRLALREMPKIE